MKTVMKTERKQARWGAYLQEFNRQNDARPTRLGVVKFGGGMEDFWLEDGLPLAGVDLDTEGIDAPRVEIMLGKEGASERSMTHTVSRVRRIEIHLSADESGEGMEIEDDRGETTVLRFEPDSMR